MKVVFAIDSMKGSLSSMEAGLAARDGLLLACPRAEGIVVPLADGGEGTTEALTVPMGGTLRGVTVTGPLGTPVEASYGIIPEKKTAIIEMASCAGLTLVPPDKRDPRITTTLGVGELIRDALEQGMRRFLIGIGGSATNDGGTGMLTALGFRFLDEDGKDLSPGGAALAQLAHIDADAVLPALKECTFRIACDVDNPLCGPRGASAVYGPQKGASPETVQALDEALACFADCAMEVAARPDPEFPGTGAAGGLGFAFHAFLQAELKSGIDIVLEETGFADVCEGADLVVTGEGRMDAQTAMGKAPVGVARFAKARGIDVIALAGSVTSDARAVNAAGIDAFFPVVRGITTLEEAMQKETAASNIRETAEQVFRLYFRQQSS